jgi:hypothetical protein
MANIDNGKGISREDIAYIVVAILLMAALVILLARNDELPSLQKRTDGIEQWRACVQTAQDAGVPTKGCNNVGR